MHDDPTTTTAAIRDEEIWETESLIPNRAGGYFDSVCLRKPSVVRILMALAVLSLSMNALILAPTSPGLEYIRVRLGLRASQPLPIEARKMLHTANPKMSSNASKPIIVTLESNEEFFESIHHHGVSNHWHTVEIKDRKDATNISFQKDGPQDRNLCIQSKHNKRDVRCLPSIIIVGFEKCSTTAMSFWLSHHPNVLSHWTEGRFWDQMPSVIRDTFAEYVYHTVPAVPGGAKRVGTYYTLEKSPAVATATDAPKMLAERDPSARFLFSIRNPTHRAYSMFSMYTKLYRGVLDVVLFRPVSFFVKDLEREGVVRYISDKGVGERGKGLPPGPGGSRRGNWEYLSFPPEPEDFHHWIDYAVSTEYKMSGREHRILHGGNYFSYLQKWLEHFPASSLSVVVSESFYSDALTKMTKLQSLLGLPLYDYGRIGRVSENGRFQLDSPGIFFNSVLNSYAKVIPMKDDTKELLDNFYCQGNRDLRNLLNGTRLPGYSCGE